MKAMPEVDLQTNQLCLKQPKAMYPEWLSDKAAQDMQMLLEIERGQHVSALCS
jgi:hypothetical protein